MCIRDSPIHSDLVDCVYREWESFFQSEKKHDYLFDPIKQDGYFPTGIENAKGYPIKDHKEFYHFYPWGRCPSSLRQELQAYFELASALASELLDWIQQHTPDDISGGYSESLSDMIVDSRETLLRVLHYPHLTGHEPTGALRAAAHEDINLLTILPSSNQSV
mgnify:CR=1 FL=1